MKKIVMLLAVAIIAIAVSSAQAQPVELVIGSGGEGGTYYPVVTEMGEFCNSDTINVVHYLGPDGKSIGGSEKNKRNLLNNKIMAGIIQNDVAQLEKMRNDAMKRLVALIPLHQEQLHFVVPVVAKHTVIVKKFGFLSSQKTVSGANPLADVSQLSGKKLAAWGGSVTSAKVVKLMADVGFEIVPTKNRAEAMKLLDSGAVNVVLSVAGAPVKWLEDLPQGKYKLLTVPSSIVDKLADVYDVANISYDNMGKTGQAIKALGVDSILFTRTYRTDKMVNALAELQSCVKEKIYEIQDTPGTHPVWQTIDPSRSVKWDKVFKKTDSE